MTRIDFLSTPEAKLIALWEDARFYRKENTSSYLCQVFLGSKKEDRFIGTIVTDESGVSLEIPLSVNNETNNIENRLTFLIASQNNLKTKKRFSDGLTQENYNIFLDKVENVLGIFGPKNSGNLLVERGTIDDVIPVLNISTPKGTLKELHCGTKQIINFVNGIENQIESQWRFPTNFKISPLPRKTFIKRLQATR